jgi:hypothetical protein
MLALPKVIGVVFFGFLLSLGLCTVAQTEIFDRKQGGHETVQKHMNEMEGSQSTGGKTISGEVLRVEGNDCVIKGQEGKEVRLQIEQEILKDLNIEPGDRIEAKVNDQNDVLSLRPAGHGSPK